MNRMRREDMTPAQFEEYSQGKKVQIARFAVLSSNYGPGLLEVEKTTYRNGDFFIYPKLIPDSLTAADRKIGKYYAASQHKRIDGELVSAPFEDGKQAVAAMREQHNVLLKIDSKG